MKHKMYTTFDIMKMFKVHRECLRSWMELGFITPTIPATGQGTKNLFDFEALVKVAVFKDLVDFGLNRTRAAEFSDEHGDCGGVYTVWEGLGVTIEIDVGTVARNVKSMAIGFGK